MSDAPLVRQDSSFTISFREEAVELKSEAIERASLIARVASEDDNDRAVAADAQLKYVLDLVEKARVQAKSPVLDRGRQIDATCKAFVKDLENERLRLAPLIGNWATLLLQRKRAEEAQQKAELDRIEREKQQALAKAQSHDEVDAIQAKANEQAAALPPPAPVAKAVGQTIKEEYEIKSINEWELMRARPDLVRKVEFDRVAIKAELNRTNGQRIPGVTAEKVVKSQTRATKAPMELSV